MHEFLKTFDGEDTQKKKKKKKKKKTEDSLRIRQMYRSQILCKTH